MNEYSCKACGASASVSEAGVITRTCRCDCGIIAEMSAVAYGEGRASDSPSKLARFAHWFAALVKARPA